MLSEFWTSWCWHDPPKGTGTTMFSPRHKCMAYANIRTTQSLGPACSPNREPAWRANQQLLTKRILHSCLVVAAHLKDHSQAKFLVSHVSRVCLISLTNWTEMAAQHCVIKNIQKKKFLWIVITFFCSLIANWYCTEGATCVHQKCLNAVTADHPGFVYDNT